MARYPVLKAREVAAILERIGFVQVRQRGAHKQYRHPDGHGWPHDLGDEEILERLLALNLERAGRE